MTHNISKIYYSLLILLSIFTFSCDKENNADNVPVEDRAKQFIFEYMNQYYLWVNEIPAGINPQSYSTPHEVLNAMRYKEHDSNLSFIQNLEEFRERKQSGKVSNAGFGVLLGSEVYDQNTLKSLYFMEVYTQSDAYQQGIRRGDQLLSVDGQSVDGANINDFYSFIGTGDSGSSKDFTILTSSGETKTLTVTKGAVYLDIFPHHEVKEIDGKKVGYLVIRSFSYDPDQFKSEITSVLSNFQAEGISDLVLDMRYNGGGNVVNSQLIAEAILPSTFTGKEFISYQFNDIVGPGEDGLNETLTFQSSPTPLELDRVFVLATGNTASASELIIKALIPYIDVKVIGETTFGKPVGGYTYEHDETNYMYYIMNFRVFNAQDETDYFDGIPADFETLDGYMYPWGDANDPMLGAALNYIQNGSYGPPARMAYPQGDIFPKHEMEEEKVIGLTIDAPNKF
ncbi:S41 family peptidase [Limibacter armeniacum]|uniref:S41 family peptidase n=1 Tax=Limibacter armeniacum TaxID=466084 RepID=UPI002FE5C793